MNFLLWFGVIVVCLWGIAVNIEIFFDIVEQWHELKQKR